MTDEPRSAIVTLLFTDLVNSTPLLQKLGEDKAQRVFEAHHQALREAAFSNNGQELEWLGDGIFAEFPSAADAVRCAMAMQRSTRRSLQGQRLQIRVGISGGEVFRSETGYFGETIVVARRLCDSAEAGQVLCSAVIAGFLAGRKGFRFESRGEQYLKGINKAQEVWEVLAAPATTTPPSAPLLALDLAKPSAGPLSGRLSATTFPITITNSGGRAVGIDLHVAEPARRLRFDFPGRITAPAGEATSAELRARPRRRRWRGAKERVPFTVSAQPGDGRPPVTASAVYNDVPYGWLPYALAAPALAIAGFAAFFVSTGGGSDAPPPAQPLETVVQVYALAEGEGGYDPVGWGSGTLVDPAGLILTSDDLVDPEFYAQPFDTIGIGLPQGEGQPTIPSYTAEVVASNALTGVAVLQITSDELGQPVDPGELSLRSAELGDSAAVETGDELEIIGYSGSGEGEGGPTGETLGSRSGDPFAADIVSQPASVTELVETFIAGRGSILQLAINASVSPGDIGGGAFNTDGELVGILISGASPEATYPGLVNPVGAATDAIVEGKERAARGGFVCAGCSSDATSDDTSESTLTEDELNSLRPVFADFTLVNESDDPIEAVPSGSQEFLLSFGYSGMVDGARFRHRCYHDPRLPVGSFAENLERDYGPGGVTTWTLGEEGTARVGCSTVGTARDGEPLPAGTYVVTLEVENLVQNPFGSPTIIFTVYGQSEVLVPSP
jgi:class 3 adenylate cyclase/S1-C subfamily serine protease